MKGIIYSITNKKNGKRYIGQTIRKFYIRINSHKSRLLLNKHHNDILQNSYNKHGGNNFIFEIIECIKNDNDDILIYELNKLEIYYIKYFKSMCNEHGYNLRDGGNNNIISEYIKSKLRGKVRTEEMKLHMSKVKTGTIVSDETKKKLSLMRQGSDHSMYGTKLTKEQKLHLSIFNTKINLETRNLIIDKIFNKFQKLNDISKELNIKYYTIYNIMKFHLKYDYTNEQKLEYINKYNSINTISYIDIFKRYLLKSKLTKKLYDIIYNRLFNLNHSIPYIVNDLNISFTKIRSVKSYVFKYIYNDEEKLKYNSIKKINNFKLDDNILLNKHLIRCQISKEFRNKLKEKILNFEKLSDISYELNIKQAKLYNIRKYILEKELTLEEKEYYLHKYYKLYGNRGRNSKK